MREAYRLQKNALTEVLQSQNISMYVFFIYTGNDLPLYSDITENMMSALIRLKKIVDEKGTVDS